MGMLATVMNALAMQDVIQKLGLACDVLSALGIEQVGEKYSALAARDKTQPRAYCDLCCRNRQSLLHYGHRCEPTCD